MIILFGAIAFCRGGEAFVTKSPSFRVLDLARVMAPGAEMEQVGIREGEKLHEWMITREDSRNTYDFDDYYVIYPDVYWWDKKRHFTPGGKKVGKDFEYLSNGNSECLSQEQIREKLKEMDSVY